MPTPALKYQLLLDKTPILFIAPYPEIPIIESPFCAGSWYTLGESRIGHSVLVRGHRLESAEQWPPKMSLMPLPITYDLLYYMAKGN